MDMLACSCCGAGIRNNAEENVSYGEKPYPHDTGYGMCRPCGGDDRVAAKKKPSDMTEKEFKKRLGWGMATFFEARFDVVRKALSPENQVKWDGCTYQKKVLVITKYVETGKMI